MTKGYSTQSHPILNSNNSITKHSFQYCILSPHIFRETLEWQSTMVSLASGNWFCVKPFGMTSVLVTNHQQKCHIYNSVSLLDIRILKYWLQIAMIVPYKKTNDGQERNRDTDWVQRVNKRSKIEHGLLIDCGKCLIIIHWSFVHFMSWVIFPTEIA